MDNENKSKQTADTTRGGPVHGTAEGQEPQPAPKPSQAEGDRETIDQDLQSKGRGAEQR